MHPVPGKVVDTQLTFAVFVLMASSDVLHGPYLLVFTNAVGAAPIRKAKKTKFYDFAWSEISCLCLFSQ